MFGSQEMTPEQNDLERNPQLLREISNENIDSDGTDSRSSSQKLLTSPLGSLLTLSNFVASSEGTSACSVLCQPKLKLLSDSDLNNNAISTNRSDDLLKNSKFPIAPKPRTPRKTKDQEKDPPKRKPKKEDDFDGLHEDGVGYSRGLLKVFPGCTPDKLIYDAFNGKLRDVGVEKAEKKTKKLEDHFFGKEA